jgi:transposase
VNESYQQEFIEKVNKLDQNSIIYVDETGINKYLYREYARAKRGIHILEKVSGKKFERRNIASGICEGKWIAPMQYTGTTDSDLFEYWFEHCLLKEAPAGTTIILDNATFHKKALLPQLAEAAGCKVLFLPPYSPELNPIEKKWAWLKKILRKILHNHCSLDSTLFSAFQVY